MILQLSNTNGWLSPIWIVSPVRNSTCPQIGESLTFVSDVREWSLSQKLPEMDNKSIEACIGATPLDWKIRAREEEEEKEAFIFRQNNNVAAHSLQLAFAHTPPIFSYILFLSAPFSFVYMRNVCYFIPSEIALLQTKREHQGIGKEGCKKYTTLLFRRKINILLFPRDGTYSSCSAFFNLAIYHLLLKEGQKSSSLSTTLRYHMRGRSFYVMLLASVDSSVENEESEKPVNAPVYGKKTGGKISHLNVNVCVRIRADRDPLVRRQ